jgi:hypothetical protein
LSIKVKHTTTKKIEGPGKLSGATLKEFASAIPDRADVEVDKDRPYPGEYGSLQWHLTASWDEE